MSLVLAFSLFLFVKLLNSSCADGVEVPSLLGVLSRSGVSVVEKGVVDSFKTRTLCALRV
jgi:hypothetical protein